MHRISLAPVLSATRSRDSCWITSAPRLLGLLEDLHQPPALGRRQRTGLHQPDAVPYAGGVVLIVCLDLVGPADHLAVERVLNPVLHGYHDRLVHLVRHHQALTDLAVTPR